MVDRDRPLVAVGAEIETRLGATGFVAAWIIEEWRSVLTCVVTGTGPLDLDDVGAEITEELSGEGRGENSTQVQYPDTVQGAAHGRAGFGSRGMRSTRSLMMFFWISLVPA